MNRKLLLLCLALNVTVVGCSKCSDQNKATPDLKHSDELKGSQALLWESVDLGINTEAFTKQIAALARIDTEEAKRRVKCTDQFAVDVIDPIEGTITERLGGKHSLTGCSFFRANDNRSWELVSVGVRFVDDVLFTVSFRLKLGEFENTNKKLTDRFGPPEIRTLVEQSLLGNNPIELFLWKVKGEIWALRKNKRNISVTKQGDPNRFVLKKPAQPKKRGEPVNLDGIGLGGGLNLDSLPKIDDVIQDAGILGGNI